MPTLSRLSHSPLFGHSPLRTPIIEGGKAFCRSTLQNAPSGVYCYQEGYGDSAVSVYVVRTVVDGKATHTEVTESGAYAEVEAQRPQGTLATAVAYDAATPTAQDWRPAEVMPEDYYAGGSPATSAAVVLTAQNNARLALAAAGQDFTPVATRLFAETAPEVADVESPNAPMTELSMVPTHRRIIRQDTGAHLSVMGSGYAPVPARELFSILDPMAKQGRIAYGAAMLWNATQSLHFSLPYDGVEGLTVGGVMVTSHDGSHALRAVATVMVGGRTIYAAPNWGTRHTKRMKDRIDEMAPAIMETVVSESEALILFAANAQVCGAAEATAAILALPMFQEILTRRAKVEVTDSDEVAAGKRATALAEATTELAGVASNYPTRLGGLRFVLAAGAFGGRGLPTEESWHYNVARARATAALQACAAAGAVLLAAIGDKAHVASLDGLDDEARKGHVEAAKARLAQRLGVGQDEAHAG
jgi:hypothetical protein